MSMNGVKHLPSGQHDNAGSQPDRGGRGERNGVVAGRVAQHAEREGSEREHRLIDRRHQRDDSRNVGGLELALGDTISSTQSGVNRIPAALAPLSAWLRARARRRSNRGDTIAMR